MKSLPDVTAFCGRLTDQLNDSTRFEFSLWASALELRLKSEQPDIVAAALAEMAEKLDPENRCGRPKKKGPTRKPNETS